MKATTNTARSKRQGPLLRPSRRRTHGLMARGGANARPACRAAARRLGRHRGSPYSRNRTSRVFRVATVMATRSPVRCPYHVKDSLALLSLGMFVTWREARKADEACEAGVRRPKQRSEAENLPARPPRVNSRLFHRDSAHLGCHFALASSRISTQRVALWSCLGYPDLIAAERSRAMGRSTLKSAGYVSGRSCARRSVSSSCQEPKKTCR